MKMNFIRPLYARMEKAGILGNGRPFIHNPLDSARGKARDPHINFGTLRSLSNNYSEEVKDFVADNVIYRINSQGKSLKDFASFGQYTLAKVIAKAKFSSKADHEFIRMFLSKVPKEHLTGYVHFKEMLINLTGYLDVDGISLSMEAYELLEPIMNEKIIAEILKKEPSRRVYELVLRHPALEKVRDREALAFLLGDFLNYNKITMATFTEQDLVKLTELFKPWRVIQKAVLDEYAKFNKPMAEMLNERLPKPEPRIRPNKLGPSNIA